jgi:hypothetical protein
MLDVGLAVRVTDLAQAFLERVVDDPPERRE